MSSGSIPSMGMSSKTEIRAHQPSAMQKPTPVSSSSRVSIPSSPVVTPHQHAAQIAGASRSGLPVAPCEAIANPKPAAEADLQAFPDVPAESMEFVERLMGNLRKLSQQSGASP